MFANVSLKIVCVRVFRDSSTYRRERGALALCFYVLPFFGCRPKPGVAPMGVEPGPPLFFLKTFLILWLEPGRASTSDLFLFMFAVTNFPFNYNFITCKASMFSINSIFGFS